MHYNIHEHMTSVWMMELHLRNIPIYIDVMSTMTMNFKSTDRETALTFKPYKHAHAFLSSHKLDSETKTENTHLSLNECDMYLNYSLLKKHPAQLIQWLSPLNKKR